MSKLINRWLIIISQLPFYLIPVYFVPAHVGIHLQKDLAQVDLDVLADIQINGS